MSYQRIDRISEQVRREVDRIIREDVSDPRVRGTFSITRADVIRRLAELAFGDANDCVRLALEDGAELKKLDLSLLSEIRRNDKGTVSKFSVRFSRQTAPNSSNFGKISPKTFRRRDAMVLPQMPKR